MYSVARYLQFMYVGNELDDGVVNVQSVQNCIDKLNNGKMLWH